MLRVVVVTFIAAVLAVTAAPASAATWSEPEPVAPTAGGFGAGQVTFLPDGTLTTVWQSYFRPVGCEYRCTPPSITYAASRSRGGSWSGAAQLSRDSRYLVGPHVAPVGANGAMVAGILEDLDFDIWVSLDVGAFVDRGGHVFDSYQRVWAGDVQKRHGPEFLSFAATPNGTRAAMAWTDSRFLDDAFVPRLYAATSNANGRFRDAVTLAKRPLGFDVAVNGRGDTAVVWQSDADINMRYALGGRKFGATRRIATTTYRPERVSIRDLSAEVDERGRVSVAWAEDGRKNDRVLLARGSARGKFAEHVLGLAHEGEVTAVPWLQLAHAGDETLAAWGSPSGTYVTTVSGAPKRQRVSRTTLRPHTLAVLPDGRAGLLGADAGDNVSVSLRRPRGGSFGPFETPPEPARRSTSMALDPDTGLPTLVYTVTGKEPVTDTAYPGSFNDNFAVVTTTRVP